MIPSTETIADLGWLDVPAASTHPEAKRAAESRQSMLTKPPGALGRLEDIAIRLAGLQGTAAPGVDRVHISVFAGDHGAAAENISAFPRSVTVEMVRNFSRGGAAICVAARSLGAKLEILNLGTVDDPEPLEGVVDARIGPGTANFVEQPAMDPHQLCRAMAAGRHAAERVRLAAGQLFIGGEMGIGNTTSASALACALLGTPVADIAGPGTGLDKQGLARKVAVIEQALAHHRAHLVDPLECLRRLGGFEIAALTGAYMACAHMGLPILVDGFISSVAALAATRLCTGAEHWMLFSHASKEPGHGPVLEALHARPLLDLGMGLGEGSGAAVAVPLLRMACDLHNRMATFEEAAVSERRP